MSSSDTDRDLGSTHLTQADVQRLQNQPFDEAYDVHGAEDIITPVPSTVSSSPQQQHLRPSAEMSDFGGSNGGGIPGDDHGDTPPQAGYDSHDEVDYDEPSHGDEESDQAAMAQADADAELQFQQQQQQRLHDDDGDESPDPDDGGPEIDFSGMGGMGGVGSTGGGATDMPGSYGGGGSGGDDGEESGDDDGPEIHWEGAYDPAEFEHLRVEDDIKDLFDCISHYKPEIRDIETNLEPFIPDYIPAVGDIDAMIKIPRHDRVDLELGLEIVDEPCAAQSDPTVLDLHLRAISKTTSVKAVEVRQIKEPNENPKALDSWITSITELHRDKPPQNIQYTTAMPDIELLMQEWPEDVEDLLRNIELPSADLDVPLSVYVSIVCALLDIPIHKSKIESLHVLFSLFVEFKNSQHFRTEEETLALTNVDVVAAAEPDVMVL